MPELPEVETTRRGLLPHILSRRVVQVVVRAPKLRWPIPTSIREELIGQVVHAVERRAKYLLLQMDVGTLIIHLGMSGRLRTLDQELPAQKHDHVDIVFEGGITLRYTDPRRFGCILWTKQPALEHELLRDLGPEPLTDGLTGKHLFDLSRNKRVPVKVFIMDPKIIVGVGNIYASEVLFAAKIHPQTPSNQVTLAQWQLIAKHIKRILQAAIEQGGTTLRDFFNTAGKPGYFSQKLKVYGREQEPCSVCESAIEAVQLGQRNTFFCPSCQS